MLAELANLCKDSTLCKIEIFNVDYLEWCRQLATDDAAVYSFLSTLTVEWRPGMEEAQPVSVRFELWRHEVCWGGGGHARAH